MTYSVNHLVKLVLIEDGDQDSMLQAVQEAKEILPKSEEYDFIYRNKEWDFFKFENGEFIRMEEFHSWKSIIDNAKMK